MKQFLTKDRGEKKHLGNTVEFQVLTQDSLTLSAEKKITRDRTACLERRTSGNSERSAD